jgi:hypothetical protein
LIVRKTEKEFGILNFMVRKARELLNAKTTLSTMKHTSGKTLNDYSAKLVLEFYGGGGGGSRCMPGRRMLHLLENTEKRVNQN